MSEILTAHGLPEESVKAIMISDIIQNARLAPQTEIQTILI